MTSAELDRLWQRAARKIVSAEITGPRAAVRGQLDQSRVLATFDDGSRVERWQAEPAAAR